MDDSNVVVNADRKGSEDSFIDGVDSRKVLFSVRKNRQIWGSKIHFFSSFDENIKGRNGNSICNSWAGTL